jgi:hypothetical protein
MLARFGVAAVGLVALAVCLLTAGVVSGRADARARYLVSIERAEQEASAARSLCLPLSGTEWERCTAKALADEWRAMADASTAQRNMPESYRLQRFVTAGTALLLLAQQCSTLSEPARATCNNIALAAYRQAISSSEPSDRPCEPPVCPRPLRPETRALNAQEV